MSKHPEVLWAQRSNSILAEKNIIYLTVNLPDIVESTLEYSLTPTTLSFKTRAGSEKSEYAFSLELFAEVDPEKSTRRITSRSLVAILRKKEIKSEYWPRLTKEKSKTPFIKTDFSKWADEDEQDGNPGLDEADELGGFPGMNGPGAMGMDFDKILQQSGAGSTSDINVGSEEDEEDEEKGPPPLESVEPAK